MFVVIFGRPACPYCVRAKELADKLSDERDDFRTLSSHNRAIWYRNSSVNC